MKFRLFLLLALLCARLSATTVTGTITDPNGNLYANGTVSAYLPLSTGNAGSVTVNGTLNSSGFFSMTLNPATYIITVCAPPANIGPKANSTPQQICFSSNPIAISGASQDVSSALNALAPLLGPSLSGIQGANNTFTGNNTFSGPFKLSNNNFLQAIKTDGVTAVNVIGVDNSNNTVISDNAGNGIFFKVGGSGVGSFAASSAANFIGNMGLNNVTINPATFGINPGIDNGSWNVSAWPFGETDATQNSNAFAATFHFKMNSSGTNTGNIEKGGAFFRCLDNDTTATTPPNCVGFDALAEGPAANSNSQLWGGLARFQIDSPGDGSGKGLEIDSTNNGTNVNNHGDAGVKTKTGLWFFATGSNPSSWMIDSATGGTGWDNGIAVRNIQSGGIGIELPNNIGAYWRNQANNADVPTITVDTSNNLVLGSTAASGPAGIFFQVNTDGGIGNYTLTNHAWSGMTFQGPTLKTVSNGAGLQMFNTTTTCTTAASAGATCTTAAISLPVGESDTSYRLVCTGKGITNVPVVIATTNSSATQFTITIAALTAAAASFSSYDCIAGHN